MMVKPWAKAIVAIPGKPTPWPTMAAAPAPMNTNAKVPINSATSLGASGLNILISRDEFPSGLRRTRARICASPTDGWMRPSVGRGEIPSLGGVAERQAKGRGDARAIGGIGLGTVADVAPLDLEPRVAHGAGGVLEQNLLLCGAHLPEQIAGLLMVIVVYAMVPIGGVAHDWQRRFDQRLVAVDPSAPAVGPIVRRGAEIAVGSHLAVAVVALERAFRRVHRDMVEVDPEPVALRVAIGEQPALQHLVRGETDTRHHIGQREGGLLHVREEVARIAVELHHPD